MFCVNYTEELALLTPCAIMPCLLFSDGEQHGENRRQQVKKEFCETHNYCLYVLFNLWSAIWSEIKLLIRMTAKQKADFGDLCHNFD
jgi:hypothetical protein